ncbi:MAG: haloacid dehalogenase [Deltaproteobacteria bacterium]|nr:haloacid dehalogenase [Deltaproteobacteria bacterium]
MSNKIRANELAFDIDGVFADTFRSFVEIARNEYGIKIEYETITEYEFWKYMDFDADIFHKIIGRILDYPIEVGIMPINGAIEVLTRLVNLGPLLFVTARPEKDAILRWILLHLKLEDMDAIRLESTGTHEEKLPVLMKYGVRYFIEDRLETCYLLEQGSVVPIVFDQPWNRKPHPFKTVKNWDEVSDMIEWEKT